MTLRLAWHSALIVTAFLILLPLPIFVKGVLNPGIAKSTQCRTLRCNHKTNHINLHHKSWDIGVECSYQEIFFVDKTRWWFHQYFSCSIGLDYTSHLPHSMEWTHCMNNITQFCIKYMLFTSFQRLAPNICSETFLPDPAYHACFWVGT
jgi:hypothetical protein